MLQAHLPESHVVKLFNAIHSGHLPTQGVPAGTAGRRALPMAGDDAAAKATVTALTDEIGYDVVDVGRSPRAGASTATSRRTAPRSTPPRPPSCSPQAKRASASVVVPRGRIRRHGRHGVRQLRRDDAVGDVALAL